MSLGLLTALLLFGPGQNAKSAELPVDPHVTCTAEEAETPEQKCGRQPATVGQIILSENEVTIIVDNKVRIIRNATRQNVILRQVPLWPGQVLTSADLREVEGNLAKLNIFEANAEQGDPSSSECYAAEEAETLAVMPQEEAKPNPTCPYLRQQAQKPTAAEPCVSETVFDKLDQLQQARSAFEQAETCRKAGDCEAAKVWYQQARQVCPNSPLDHKIALRMKELEEPQEETVAPASDPEDAEPDTGKQTEPLPCRTPKPVEAEVAELVEACQRAIADGDYSSARSLVYQALLLDPACVAVNALVEKLREMGPASNQPEEGAQEPSESPPPADPISAPEEMLQPPLPPVDPGIVDALEKVLRKTGEPTTPKLVIGMEEPQDDEPEEPVSQWRSGAPDVEAPSLLVDPEEEDSSLEDPAAGEENPPADPNEIPRAALEQMLREACAAIEQGKYVALHEQEVQGSRNSLFLRIRGIQCRLIADDWGHRYLIVRLTPEASGDLRLMQQAHNERVLSWIVAHNSGGNLEAGAEEPAGCDGDDLDRLREDIEDPEPEEDANG